MTTTPTDPATPAPAPDPARDAALLAIARRVLRFETLEERGLDRLDFREVSAAAVKEALERAYQAGRESAPGR